MAIQIQISDDLWEILKDEKKRGESFDEVLKRLLKIEKEKKQ